MSKSSSYTWLIDSGHGAINNNGFYTTAPAKMHTFEDGLTIYEGVINRDIASLLYKGLNNYDINYRLLYDNSLDTPLWERVQMANVLQMRYGNCIGISIHSNAGGGQGFEIWTSPGHTKADDVANVIYRKYIVHFPEHKFRVDMIDNDPDKEAAFYILKNTICPFVLVENLFFDYRKDAELLISQRGKQRIADALLDAIIEINDNKLI